MKSRSISLTTLALLQLCVWACGSSDKQSPKSCTPGEQRACACPGSGQGVQVCSADGALLGECTGCFTGTTGGSGTATTGSTGTNANGTSTAGGNLSAGGNAPLGGAPSAGGNAPLGGATSTGGSSTFISVTMGGIANASGGNAPLTGGASNAPPSSFGGTSGSSQTASGGAGAGGLPATTLTTTLVTTGGNPALGGAGSATGGTLANGGSGTTGPATGGAFTSGGEPSCPPSGGACTTRCGDGFVLGAEACDDGNAISGDGCSADCQVEITHTCVPSAPGDTLVLPMSVRDFDAGSDFEKGGSFALDLIFPNQGLVNATLDGMKPSLKSITGTYDNKPGTDSGIASPASFAQWFDSAANGPNKYHASLTTSLILFRTGDGLNYANRFGTNGDGHTNVKYQRTADRFCGIVGNEDHDADGNPIPCTYCPFDTDPLTPQCDPAPQNTDCSLNHDYIACVESAGTWYGRFITVDLDGNPLFFPADAIAKPWSPSSYGEITGNYDPTWPEDTGPHNFSFTTEVHFWFLYDSAKSYTLSFTGDDDVWVFVNKHLALDMGGIHTPVQGALTFGSAGVSASVTNTLPTGTPKQATSTPDLGALESGNLYEVAIFQAERQTRGSSYGLTVSAEFASPRSACSVK